MKSRRFILLAPALTGILAADMALERGRLAVATSALEDLRAVSQHVRLGQSVHFGRRPTISGNSRRLIESQRKRPINAS